MKVICVVGARPNFMKIGPIHRAFQARGAVDSVLVHTGQHYDTRMSEVFFRDLGLPEPDHLLGIGGGSHAEQTAGVMLAFEKIVLEEAPDMVLVVGDVNSTLAAALVAAKLHVPVAHVEAGLRSGDRRMPEELNRICTDALSDLLFVTELSGMENLRNEGISEDRVHFVGNVLIDSLIHFRERASSENAVERMGLRPGEYILMTMHRPSNVDLEHPLTEVVRLIEGLAQLCEVVLPLHPRTAKNLSKFGLTERLDNIASLSAVEPLGYLEFLGLMDEAAVVVTDSGGIQEETTFLDVPCITLRENTERPVTIQMGTNELAPLDADYVIRRVEELLASEKKATTAPPLWDGRAADRITDIITDVLSRTSHTLATRARQSVSV